MWQLCRAGLPASGHVPDTCCQAQACPAPWRPLRDLTLLPARLLPTPPEVVSSKRPGPHPSMSRAHRAPNSPFCLSPSPAITEALCLQLWLSVSFPLLLFRECALLHSWGQKLLSRLHPGWHAGAVTWHLPTFACDGLPRPPTAAHSRPSATYFPGPVPGLSSLCPYAIFLAWIPLFPQNL